MEKDGCSMKDKRGAGEDKQNGCGLPAGAGILARADGTSTAYHRIAGTSPGVVFLHGLRSDMTGGKAQALEAFCRAGGHAFVRFDCFGHGTSSGAFTDGTIGRWAADAVAVLDALTAGPQVLVGSSMGGWTALLAALARPTRVSGLVGVAAAPDFTEELMWAEFSPEQRRRLVQDGEVVLPDDYDPDRPLVVSRALIEDGRNHLLLPDAVNLACPVRLIHGQRDADVPWRTALRLADSLASADVEVILVKDGDHRLSRDHDLARMVGVVAALLGKIDPSLTSRNDVWE